MEQNVRAAIIMRLNTAVPPEYRQIPDAVGTREFRITDSPLDILNQLRAVYGPLSPTERMSMENLWAQIWNPQVPIEAYFKQLEDIYEQALAHPPAYTSEQMIGKAITSMEQCGLFPTALLEWNGFDPTNKDWANLKAHFSEAYRLCITSGPAGRKLLSGVVANAQTLTEKGEEDDDLTIITNALGEVTMANNAATETMREQLATLNQEVASMRAALATNTQGTVTSGQTSSVMPTSYNPPPPAPATTTYQTAVPTPMPHTYQTPVPHQVAYAAVPPAPPAPPAPAMPYHPPAPSVPMVGAPPPQAYEQHQQPYQGRGGGGRGRGGRGKGRGGKNTRYRLAHARQPPGQYSQQGHGQQGPPAGHQGHGGGTYGTQKSYRKYYNNMNMCFSCGFDVPCWHTSATCPQECRRVGHQEKCTRENYKSYVQAGHNVRLQKEDAYIMPTNPGPHQA